MVAVFVKVMNALLAMTGGSVMLAILLLALIVELVLLYPSARIQLKQKKIHLFHKKIVDRFNRGELSYGQTEDELHKLYSVNEKIHSRGAMLVVAQVILFLFVLWNLNALAGAPELLNGQWNVLNLSLLDKPFDFIAPLFASMLYFFYAIVKIYCKEKEDYIAGGQTMLAIIFAVISSAVVYFFVSTFALALSVYFSAIIAFATLRYIIVEQHAREWGRIAWQELIEMLRNAKPHRDRFEYISQKWNHLPVIRYINFHLLEEALSMTLGLLLALNFFGVFQKNEELGANLLLKTPAAMAAFPTVYRACDPALSNNVLICNLNVSVDDYDFLYPSTSLYTLNEWGKFIDFSGSWHIVHFSENATTNILTDTEPPPSCCLSYTPLGGAEINYQVVRNDFVYNLTTMGIDHIYELVENNIPGCFIYPRICNEFGTATRCAQAGCLFNIVTDSCTGTSNVNTIGCNYDFTIGQVRIFQGCPLASTSFVGGSEPISLYATGGSGYYKWKVMYDDAEESAIGNGTAPNPIFSFTHSHSGAHQIYVEDYFNPLNNSDTADPLPGSTCSVNVVAPTLSLVAADQPVIRFGGDPVQLRYRVAGAPANYPVNWVLLDGPGGLDEATGIYTPSSNLEDYSDDYDASISVKVFDSADLSRSSNTLTINYQYDPALHNVSIASGCPASGSSLLIGMESRLQASGGSGWYGWKVKKNGLVVDEIGSEDVSSSEFVYRPSEPGTYVIDAEDYFESGNNSSVIADGRTATSCEVTVTPPVLSLDLTDQPLLRVGGDPVQLRYRVGGRFNTDYPVRWQLAFGNVGALDSVTGIYTPTTNWNHVESSINVRVIDANYPENTSGTAIVLQYQPQDVPYTSITGCPHGNVSLASAPALLRAGGGVSGFYKWTVRSSGGTILSENGDGTSANSAFTFTATLPGSYSIDVEDYHDSFLTTANNSGTCSVNVAVPQLTLTAEDQPIIRVSNPSLPVQLHHRADNRVSTYPVRWQLVSGPGGLDATSGMYTPSSDLADYDASITVRVRDTAYPANASGNLEIDYQSENIPTVSVVSGCPLASTSFTLGSSAILRAQGGSGIYRWEVIKDGLVERSIGDRGASNATFVFNPSAPGMYNIYTEDFLDTLNQSATCNINVITPTLTLADDQPDIRVNGPNVQLIHFVDDEINPSYPVTWSLIGPGDISDTGVYTPSDDFDDINSSITVRVTDARYSGNFSSSLVLRYQSEDVSVASGCPADNTDITLGSPVLLRASGGSGYFKWLVQSAGSTSSPAGDGVSAFTTFNFNPSAPGSYLVDVEDFNAPDNSSYSLVQGRTHSTCAINVVAPTLSLLANDQPLIRVRGASVQLNFRAGNDINPPYSVRWSLISGPGALSNLGVYTPSVNLTDSAANITVLVTDTRYPANFSNALTINYQSANVSITSGCPRETLVSGNESMLRAAGGSGYYRWIVRSFIPSYSMAGDGVATFAAFNFRPSTPTTYIINVEDYYNSANNSYATGGNRTPSACTVNVLSPTLTLVSEDRQPAIRVNGPQVQLNYFVDDRIDTTYPVIWSLLSGPGELSNSGLYRPSINPAHYNARITVRITDVNNSGNTSTQTLQYRSENISNVSLISGCPASTPAAANDIILGASSIFSAQGGSGFYRWKVKQGERVVSETPAGTPAGSAFTFTPSAPAAYSIYAEDYYDPANNSDVTAGGRTRTTCAVDGVSPELLLLLQDQDPITVNGVPVQLRFRVNGQLDPSYPVSWSVTGPGTFDPDTGLYTPSEDPEDFDASIEVMVTDAANVNNRSASLNIPYRYDGPRDISLISGCPASTPATANDIILGASSIFSAQGGSGFYRWKVKQGERVVSETPAGTPAGSAFTFTPSAPAAYSIYVEDYYDPANNSDVTAGGRTRTTCAVDGVSPALLLLLQDQDPITVDGAPVQLRFRVNSQINPSYRVQWDIVGGPGSLDSDTGLYTPSEDPGDFDSSIEVMVTDAANMNNRSASLNIPYTMPICNSAFGLYDMDGDPVSVRGQSVAKNVYSGVIYRFLIKNSIIPNSYGSDAPFAVYPDSPLVSNRFGFSEELGSSYVDLSFTDDSEFIDHVFDLNIWDRAVMDGSNSCKTAIRFVNKSQKGVQPRIPKKINISL